jgi:sirohydrochlorin cobaltochelatase
MNGILLFGHGARNPEWALPFQRIRDAILARQPQALVETGFLELMRPTFDEAVASLVAGGVTEIMVVPIFMASGSHVRKDLPQMAANAMERHAGLVISLAAPVGEAAPVLAAMADYALAPVVAESVV